MVLQDLLPLIGVVGTSIARSLSLIWLKEPFAKANAIFVVKYAFLLSLKGYAFQG